MTLLRHNPPRLTVGELFAGISGFGRGFELSGFSVAWQVEIEPFARAVLATHFPKAERFEDVKTVGRHNLGTVDVICAGVPCQDVSVAGKRAGLAGERTGLFYEFARILQELRPAWFVFENVPGLLSSNRGRDFAEILRVLMVECGYGVQWRVLNSQFFGVAQRRRRVFIVGRFGRPCPAEILFESEGGSGDFEASGEERSNASAEVERSITQSCFKRHDEDTDTLVAATLHDRIKPKRDGCDHLVAATLRAADGHHGRSSPRGDGQDNLVATLNSGGNSSGFRTEPGEHLVAFHENISGNVAGAGHARSLRSGASHSYQFIGTETNPDRMRDFAGLPEGLDSARYRALGNAVTVQVAQWIAQRILAHESRCA